MASDNDTIIDIVTKKTKQILMVVAIVTLQLIKYCKEWMMNRRKEQRKNNIYYKQVGDEGKGWC